MKAIYLVSLALFLALILVIRTSEAIAQRESDSIHHAPHPSTMIPFTTGAANPVLIWNREEQSWWMLYTTRRVNMPTVDVSAYFGNRIGIAFSANRKQPFDFWLPNGN